jgi:hypothetical protein
MISSLQVFRLLLFIVLILSSLSPAQYAVLKLDGDLLRPIDFGLIDEPGDMVFPLRHAIIGQNELCIQIVSATVELYDCGDDHAAVIWQSPQGWQVREAFFSDLNRDKEPELALLVWRPFKTWPVDSFLPQGGRISTFHNMDGYSCHLILIQPDGDFKELWAGSALANPLHSLVAFDLDGDGWQELVGIEYAYDSNSTAGSIVAWQWNGFGFSLLDREVGKFSSFQVIDHKSTVTLIAEKN